MSSRTYTWNAYESQLAGPLLAGATSVAVDSAIGLDDPCYLVIDPDIPLKREWVRVNTINANNLENMIRNQQGSVGDIDHISGAKVRAIFTKQLQDDIFDDLEDAELWITGHVNVIQQPHPHAQYLREADANGIYLQLSGASAMTGPLSLADGLYTQPLHAVPKQYVDDQVALYLPLTGGIVDGNLTVTKDLNIGDVSGAHLVIDEDPENVFRFYVQNGPGTGTRYGLQMFANGLDVLDVAIDGRLTLVGDPVNDGNVGNRSYNDTRYLALSGGTVAGALTVTGSLAAEVEFKLGTTSDPHLHMDESPSGTFRIFAKGGPGTGTHYGLQFFGDNNDILDVAMDGRLSIAGQLDVPLVTGNMAFSGNVDVYKLKSTGALNNNEQHVRNIQIGVQPAGGTEITGDLWFDVANKALKSWSSTSWALLLQGV